MPKKTPDDISNDNTTVQDSSQNPKNQKNIKNHSIEHSADHSKTTDKTHTKQQSEQQNEQQNEQQSEQQSEHYTSILDDMDAHVQHSLLMGIQESLEALFSIGDSSSHLELPKKTSADRKTESGLHVGVKNGMEVDNDVKMKVVEGGLSERHIDKLKNDKLKNDKLDQISEKPSLELVKEDIQTQEQDVQPLSEYENSDGSDVEHINSKNRFFYEKQKKHKKNVEENVEENYDITTQFQKHLEQFFEGSDVEFQVFSSDEFFDFSEISDVLKQFHGGTPQNTEKNLQKKESPNFEVFSFEDKKEQNLQKKQIQKQGEPEVIPPGIISLALGASQKIYIGTQHRTYRIFCEEGILLVKFCTPSEYSGVRNQSYFTEENFVEENFIEEEITTLFAGQSIDVAYNHIEIQAIQSPQQETLQHVVTKGRYFLIQEVNTRSE